MNEIIGTPTLKTSHIKQISDYKCVSIILVTSVVHNSMSYTNYNWLEAITTTSSPCEVGLKAHAIFDNSPLLLGYQTCKNPWRALYFIISIKHNTLKDYIYLGTTKQYSL